MCCAVQFAQIENFVTQSYDTEEPDFEAYPVLNKQVSTKENARLSNFETVKTDMTGTCLKQKSRKPATGASELSSEEEGGKKKKKKWKKLSLTDTGFNLSLFPRPVKATVEQEEEERIFQKVEHELEIFEDLLNKAEEFHHLVVDDVSNGAVCAHDTLQRRDRHQRVRKAGKQVKDKYCKSLKNNGGRKKLFIHHRLFKLINLEERRMNFIPSPKHYSRNIINNKATNETRSKLKPHNSAPYGSGPKPAPVQNLRHTLHQTNAPSEMESSLMNLLISLQHRDLTPEDYDVLLQLDESVAPKTVDKSLLSTFKTDTVTAENAGDLCPVCMDQFELGQSRKFLPCDHVFHTSCIDMWLDNSSRNCPVDGLPVDEAS